MGKYPKYDDMQLPGYILPRVRRKGAWYGHKLKVGLLFISVFLGRDMWSRVHDQDGPNSAKRLTTYE